MHLRGTNTSRQAFDVSQLAFEPAGAPGAQERILRVCRCSGSLYCLRWTL